MKIKTEAMDKDKQGKETDLGKTGRPTHTENKDNNKQVRKDRRINNGEKKEENMEK